MAVLQKADSADTLTTIIGESTRNLLPCRYVSGRFVNMSLLANTWTELNIDLATCVGDMSLLDSNNRLKFDMSGLWFLSIGDIAFSTSMTSGMRNIRIAPSAPEFALANRTQIAVLNSSVATGFTQVKYITDISALLKIEVMTSVAESIVTSTFCFGQLGFVDQYSTSETFTGKYWIDGKKIYRTVLTLTNVPAGDSSYVHNIPNISIFVSCRAISIWNGDASAGMGEVGGDTGLTSNDASELSVWADFVYVKTRLGADRIPSYDLNVILEYICTDR